MPKSRSHKNYTLGCEKRLDEFKVEFTQFVENQINNQNGSFDDYYKRVFKHLKT